MSFHTVSTIILFQDEDEIADIHFQLSIQAVAIMMKLEIIPIGGMKRQWLDSKNVCSALSINTPNLRSQDRIRSHCMSMVA